MRKLLRGALMAALLILLGGALNGCGMFKPMEDLYALPALSEEYSRLQTSIQTVLDEMQAEYATISYGSNTSTIQLLDLDGDGFQETAAVFLRVTAAEEKPLRVCLFRRSSDNTYTLTHTVQGEGTSINSVAYEDLTGDGARELVISWQMSAKVHILSAYQVSGLGTNELLNTTYNESYLPVDMNGDGCKEIVVFQQHSTDAESNRAEFYRYQEGTMTMVSVAQLSDSLKDVTAVKSGSLADGVTGIYVTCEVDGGVLTDILVLEEDGLRNVTRDPELGVSQGTARSYTEVGATDINRDGILEIPMPAALPPLDAAASTNYYMIYWRQFDSSGEGAVVSTTYHSVSDGWFFVLPGSWPGKVTVGRDDSRSIRGERAVVFYYWPDAQTTEPKAFLTIYRLTGDNRYSRANLAGRVTLFSDNSAIYCGALNPGVWDCGLKSEQLAQQFYLITTEWSSQ